MKSNSQSGQDIFVSNLIKNKNAVFVDLGCWHPTNLNNTFQLEMSGWDGISIDILDMNEDWKSRKTKFIQSDVLNIDYNKLFDEHNFPLIIDYLTIDIEGDGLRYMALKKVLESNREFKIITIEHDIYRGYENTETIPQRNFLKERGYFLLCSNVCLGGNPFEDWWINPQFFHEKEYVDLMSDNIEYSEILKKIKI